MFDCSSGGNPRRHAASKRSPSDESVATEKPMEKVSVFAIFWSIVDPHLKHLNFFFSFHYLFPFLIAGLTIAHLTLLHQTGNNNPLGVDSTTDKMPFYPYCYVKDLFVFLSFAVFFSVMVFFYPNEKLWKRNMQNDY